MTGGQKVEGALTVPMIARQLLAEDVARVVVVTDDVGKYVRGALPRERGCCASAATCSTSSGA